MNHNTHSKFNITKSEAIIFENLIRGNGYKTIVEVGVAYGSTTKHLCKGAKDINGMVYGFDCWETHGLKSQYGAKGSLKNVASCLRQTYDNFQLFKVNTRTEKDRFIDLLDKECPVIDFCFIDGCHSYDGIENDFTSVYPKLSDKGMIALHDTLHSDGCREFLLELRTIRNDGTFDICEFPHGGKDGENGGTAFLVKRTYSKLYPFIPQVNGSKSSVDEILKNEKEWYESQLNMGDV